MRRGFYFMLMWVLVLRGLTGTAMAAGMLPPLAPMNAQHQQTQDHTHGDAAHAANPMAFGHDGHHGIDAANTAPDHHDAPAVAAAAAVAVAVACDSTDAACAGHDHHASTCSACGICHSAMLEARTALIPSPLPTGTALPGASAQFDSAPAALVIKPPIA